MAASRALLSGSLLALCAAAGAFGAASDLVNERIPVTRAEMEAHWHIDCSALLERYNRALRERFRGAPDEMLQDMAREATLCSFVDAARREERCPDYSAISAVLQGVVGMRGEGGDPGQLQAPEVRCD